jgi:prepilin-type N-terminal cleavage/methylation domain-containing protein
MTNHKGFTLLELLVVIAILAVLAAVTVVVINPTELVRRSRDVQRLNDLAAIVSAVSFYMVETTSPSLGTCGATIGAAQCRFTAVPSGTSPYGCGSAATSSSGAVDGTGWIPVNLASLTTGSPIPAFPIDPVNGGGSASPSTFYTYACRSNPLGFELVANMESTTYKAKEGTDGGVDINTYETGTVVGFITSGVLTTVYTNHQ